MAAMPIYGKTFKNPLLQNLKSDFLETWYETLVTGAPHSLHQWWPRIDLDLLYDKAKMFAYVFQWKTVYSSHLMKKACNDCLNWLKINVNDINVNETVFTILTLRDCFPYPGLIIYIIMLKFWLCKLWRRRKPKALSNFTILHCLWLNLPI